MARSIRRLIGVGAALAAATLIVSGCSSSGKPAAAPSSAAPSKLTGTVTFWHFFNGREAAAIQSVVNDFEKANPGVKVIVKSNQSDDKTLQAISAGQPIDVVLSYSTDQIGKFCSSGAWRDLGPYITRDGVDLNQIPQTVRDYTEFKGVRCSMPVLADTYGLYYNKTMLAAAGYTAPPKSMAEFDAMAKKMTVLNKDGSIKVAGFVPTMGFYENAPAHFAPSFGATWLKADGTSNIGTDPNWQTMLNWQKGLVDYYGYNKLTKFTAGLGQEFSSDNAFEAGKVAMMIDGEYRNAFIKAEHPKLQYGTAAFPVDNAQPNLYGAGYITGNVIGIGKASQNPEASWALIKYLSTNTDAVVKLANGIKNVPTTLPALNSPNLIADENFKPFLAIFSNPNSGTTPASPNGGAYQQTMATFVNLWQQGKVTDLNKGLATVDKQINDALTLQGAP
jgi:multiple sugar transport system substrate-binding protein